MSSSMETELAPHARKTPTMSQLAIGRQHDGDARRNMPAGFQGDNLRRNLALVEELKALAAAENARDPWPGGGDQPWRAGSHGTDHLRAARRHLAARRRCPTTRLP
jgi:hypothetical protein